VIARPFATAESNSGDPKDCKDDSSDPQRVDREARTRKYQHQEQQQNDEHDSGPPSLVAQGGQDLLPGTSRPKRKCGAQSRDAMKG
jgi:hypothetical protein